MPKNKINKKTEKAIEKAVVKAVKRVVKGKAFDTAIEKAVTKAEKKQSGRWAAKRVTGKSRKAGSQGKINFKRKDARGGTFGSGEGPGRA
jgi:hypothetical protein